MSGSDLARLEFAGFTRRVWTRIEDVPTAPGVYAFVVRREVMYIGSAQGSKGSMRGRIRNYQRHQREDSETKRRRPVHREITRVHKNKGKIDVYTLRLRQSQQIKWKGLPVDLASGLEAGLIRELHPKWNHRGR